MESATSPVSEKNISLLLYNVRSAHNVGAIFRTADAAGVKEILLAGYTPAPIDRFGRKRNDIAKAALGAEDLVPWRVIEGVEAFIREFKNNGGSVVAVEQMPTSIPYTQHTLTQPTLFILGNEIAGVPQEICDSADACIEIAMSGTKESLNVAVTAGVILFHFRDFRTP